MTYAETGAHAHYVTMRSDSKRHMRLAGPFRTRQQAEENVDRAKSLAMGLSKGTALQPDFSFGGYGVARMTFKPGFLPQPAKLNEHLGLEIDPETGYVRET